MKYSLFLFAILVIDFVVILFKIKFASSGHSPYEAPLPAGKYFSDPGPELQMTSESQILPFAVEGQLNLINVNKSDRQYTSWPQDLL